MFSLESRLRRRLLLGVLVVSLVLAFTVRRQVRQEQSILLNYQLEQVARAILLSDLPSVTQNWDSDPALHLDVQVWDTQGGLLYRSSDLINVARDTASGLSSARSGNQADAVQLKVFTLSNSKRTVQVMHAQDLRDELRMDAELEVLIPAMLVMLVGAILVALTLRKELEPIRELDAELSRRDVDSLQPVTLTHAPAELASVVDTLNRLLQQLDASLQAHKRFIANAAHELRTPITALSLEVDNLARAQDQTQIMATANRLKLGTHRAQHLLQQMLTLARLEARRQPQPRVAIDLQALAQLSMIDLSALASHKGVELELEGLAPAFIQGDADDLRLLLDNLLGNALKFSPSGGVVKLILTRQEQGVVLQVCDEGPGIAPELRERILLPFVRVDAAVEGAGLGLAIVQEVVSNLGATMLLDSPSDGKGLRVTICFPA